LRRLLARFMRWLPVGLLGKVFAGLLRGLGLCSFLVFLFLTFVN
jgi:hypothetical protein